jgi:polar amino acid transport system substrate-binding protein
VDSSNAPYAGTSNGKLVGIDVDIAAALADQLGLTLNLVDVSSQTPDALLQNKTIDVTMDVERNANSSASSTLVGPYILSGPALFANASNTGAATVSFKSLATSGVEVQSDSLSSYRIDQLAGSGTSHAVDSLDDLFNDVDNGTATYGAADAIVGSYVSTSYPNVVCAQLIGTPVATYMDTATGNSAMVAALSTALDNIRSNGTLAIIVSKWVGPSAAALVTNTANISAATSATTSGDTGSSSSVDTADTNQAADTGSDLPDPSNAGGSSGGTTA